MTEEYAKVTAQRDYYACGLEFEVTLKPRRLVIAGSTRWYQLQTTPTDNGKGNPALTFMEQQTEIQIDLTTFSLGVESSLR